MRSKLSAARLLQISIVLFLFVLLAQVFTGESVQAQSADIVISQSVSWIYGQSITFTANVSAPTSIVGARIIFQPQYSAEYQVSVPIENSSRSVSHTAQVGDLFLPPAARFSYYWELTDSTGETHLSAQTSGLYADNRVPWAWAETERGNISILSDGSDPSLAQAALTIGETSREIAGQFVGRTNSSDITIFVYPNLVTLANSLRAHRLIVDDWVAAYAMPEHQVIFVAVESGAEMMVGLERDIRHEMVHLAVADAAGEHLATVPGWFNEGLAIYISGASDPGLDSAMTDAIDTRILPSLALQCVRNFANLPPRDAALAYAQSASVVSYIVDRYGPTQIANIMSAYAQGLGCTEGVDRALGISLNELESQWLRHLSTSAQSTQPTEVSLTPWLIGWLASIVLALLFIAPQPTQPAERSDPETRLALPPVQSNPS